MPLSKSLTLRASLQKKNSSLPRKRKSRLNIKFHISGVSVLHLFLNQYINSNNREWSCDWLKEEKLLRLLYVNYCYKWHSKLTEQSIPKLFQTQQLNFYFCFEGSFQQWPVQLCSRLKETNPVSPSLCWLCVLWNNGAIFRWVLKLPEWFGDLSNENRYACSEGRHYNIHNTGKWGLSNIINLELKCWKVVKKKNNNNPS